MTAHRVRQAMRACVQVVFGPPDLERQRQGGRKASRAFLAMFFLAIIPALGQETRSVISGRVLDPDSAAVAGAKVTVLNTGTNVATPLVANETGYYEATLLLPGTYRVTVERQGFKTSVRDGIQLPVSTRLQVDVQLELGETTETATVTAEAPLLDLNTMSSGRSIDTRSIEDLPIPGGNSATLARLVAGIQTPDSLSDITVRLHSNGAGTRYSVGGNVGGNEFSIDGTSNAGNGRNIAYMPAPEILQEMRVETSAFDASMGHSTGVNVAMMTKTGTNAYHGALRETHRQSRWAALPFFTKRAYFSRIAQAEAEGNRALADALRSRPGQAPGRQNQYAATLGGPVVLPKLFNGQNKLFFFFGFTGFRVGEYRTSYETVPTEANLQGDFSQLLQVDPVRYQIYDPLSIQPNPARPGHYIRQPFPGNIIPRSRITNPAYRAYVSLLPKANNNPADPRLEPTRNVINYSSPYAEAYDSFANRIDYHISDKHRVFGRWSWNKWTNNNPGWLWNSPARDLFDTGAVRKNFGIAADWVYTLGTATVLDVAVANNQYDNSAYIRKPSKPSDFGLPEYLDVQAGPYAVIPTMTWSGYNGISNNYPAVDRSRTLSGKADLFHVRGAHSMKAGIDFRGQFLTGFNPGVASGAFNFGNSWTRRDDDTFTPAGSLGHSWAAFMMGLPDTVQIDTNDSRALSNPYYAWYFQDNWRATSKLSLNFGLRMEYELGVKERFGRALSTLDPNAPLPITDAVQAAYARNPVPELAASQFVVKGGSVYATAGGANRRLWNRSLAWLPRIGVAYQLNSKTVLRGGYGIFSDTLNALNQANPDQTGFSRRTSSTMSNDFGVTWQLGDPRNGVSPLTDPFPVRADGTRFDPLVRDRLGLMARVGRGWNYNPYDRKHARQQRWRIGVQRQIGGRSVIEVAYAGSYSDNISVSKVLSALPGQYWADGLVRNDAIASSLNANVPNPFYIGNLTSVDPLVYGDLSTNAFFTSPTIRKSQLLRPFPHMNGISANLPVGEATSHALEVSFSRRLSQGLSFNLAYTALRLREADIFLNEFDAAPSWRESNNGRPHRVTAASIYELPFGEGRFFANSGLMSQLFGGFQVSGIFEWQPGPLIDWPNLFYYGNLADIGKGPKTVDQWFNTANFERDASRGPANFHRRVFPTRIAGVRADMLLNWNGSIQREFRIKERAGLQLRMDVMNLLNRSQFSAPNVNPFSTDFGKVLGQPSLSGEGGGASNRWVQIQARLQF